MIGDSFCGFDIRDFLGILTRARKALWKLRRVNSTIFEDAMSDSYNKMHQYIENTMNGKYDEDKNTTAEGNMKEIPKEIPKKRKFDYLEWKRLVFLQSSIETRVEAIELGLKIFIVLIRSRFYNELKHESHTVAIEDEEILFEQNNDFTASIDAKHDAEIYMAELMKQYPLEYEAVKLLIMEDKNNEEAAEIMQCSLTTARQRKSRGLIHLRKIADNNNRK